MKKRILVGAALTGAVLLGACTHDASQTDLSEPKQVGRAVPSDYKAVAPDSITVFQNVNEHPNLVRLCADGLAFLTVSSSHTTGFTKAWERIPEWDAYCKSVQPK
jgi:hypothetical protein